MKLFIINGGGGVGKDEFVNYCMRIYKDRGFESFSVSSVDKIKEAARVLGWDGVKNEKNRKFLSDLKDMSTEFNSGPLKYMEQRMTLQDDNTVIFFHIREPSEIKRFVRRHPLTETILLTRKDVETFSNHADKDVNNYKYNHYILNDEDLKELRETAGEFVRNSLLTKDNLYVTNKRRKRKLGKYIGLKA